MAIVFRGHDVRLQRDVAIKLIRTEMFPPAILNNILERFEREAQALARLDHPNIVHLYDYGELAGAPYLVMEYLPGGTLRQRLGQPQPYRQAAAILAPIARAMEYAHCENVIHRDIKPANILFTRRDIPKISDFGIAKLFGMDEAVTLTSTGMGLGTPAYMAPEQWSGKTSPAVDVYALGVVFYEMLTGKPPYQADTPAELFAQVLTQPPPDPRKLVTNLPQEALDILGHSLAKQPGDRYTGMAAMAADLEALVAQPQIDIPTTFSSLHQHPGENFAQASSASIATSSQPTPLSNLPTLALDEESAPRLRQPAPAAQRKIHIPWLVLGGVTLLVLFGIFGGWTIWQRSQASPTTTKTNASIGLITQPSNTPTASRTPAPSETPTPPENTATPTLTFTATDLPLATTTPTPKPTLLIGSTRTAEKDSMVQAYIPAGEFWMGSEAPETMTHGILPLHRVYLDAFWMDQTEVTNAMYQLCVRDGVCQLPNSDRSNTRNSYYGDNSFANYPVIHVSWQDAQDYCTWAGRRLPSEAQWEKAGRGMLEGKLFPWGNDWPNCLIGGTTSAQFNECSLDDTVAVGSFGANGYGLYDMAGNVWEWVADWHNDDYYITYNKNSWPKNPTGPDFGGTRVKRGGSWTAENWGNIWIYLTVSYRGQMNPNESNNNTGFRCAATVEP
jgi:serine/threonine protein kinase